MALLVIMGMAAVFMIASALTDRRAGNSRCVGDDVQKFSRECLDVGLPATNLIGNERLLNFGPTFLRDRIAAGDHDVRCRHGLFALKGIVPKSLLPPLGVDHGDLNGIGELLQSRIESEGFDECPRVGRSIGLHNHHAIRAVSKPSQLVKQLLARPATNAVSAQGANFVDQVAELLGVDFGILVVVDQKPGLDSAGRQSWNQTFQKRRFPRSQKSHN